MLDVRAVGEAQAFDFVLDVVLHGQVGHAKSTVVHHAFAVRPVARRQVGLEQQIDDLGRATAVDGIAGELAVSAGLLVVPAFIHEEVHVFDVTHGHGPAVEAAQCVLLGHIR